MQQKILIVCLILVLLIAGCSPQPENAAPAPDGSETELPAEVISPTEIGLDTEASVYPEPVTEEILQETTYPPPDTGVINSPYPEPNTDIIGVSPYPAPEQSTSNNISTPFNPVPGEESMTKGPVYIDKFELSILAEDDPPTAGLYLVGSLPTPCAYLRLNMTAPDAENKISIEAYSVTDPEGVCIQVLLPFETLVSLGSFASGTYTIWVNGQQVGKYTQ